MSGSSCSAPAFGTLRCSALRLIKNGRKLRNVLAAALQSHFGFESADLLKFGINPRVDGARRTSKAKRELEELKAELERAELEKATQELVAKVV